MNRNMMLKVLQNKNKGQWFRVAWVSDLPVKAAYKRGGTVVNKRTVTTARFGINYSNMKSVQAKVERGFELKHELPWGSWDDQYPGILINHKGQTYIRLYNSPNKPKSEYFLNGKPITKEELIQTGVVQDSYWKKNSEPTEVFTIKVENIENIF